MIQLFSGRGSAGRVIQCKTNIDFSDWQTYHNQTIAYDSGGANKVVEFDLHEENIKVFVTENRLNHFCNGHLIREYSFMPDNIGRTEECTFWPAATTVQQIKDLAKRFLQSLEEDIIEKVQLSGSNRITGKSHKFEGASYVFVVVTNSTDDDGIVTGGTAELTQFYLKPGHSGLYAEQEDLAVLNDKLKKKVF